jgi:hypothetical protein
LDFNVDIKRIKLRDKLSVLLKDPKLYLRQYVEESVYNTFLMIKALKTCSTMLDVHNRSLYPDAKVTFDFGLEKNIYFLWFLS